MEPEFLLYPKPSHSAQKRVKIFSKTSCKKDIGSYPLQIVVRGGMNLRFFVLFFCSCSRNSNYA